jgi:hypothetical protein
MAIGILDADTEVSVRWTGTSYAPARRLFVGYTPRGFGGLVAAAVSIAAGMKRALYGSCAGNGDLSAPTNTYERSADYRLFWCRGSGR